MVFVSEWCFTNNVCCHTIFKLFPHSNLLAHDDLPFGECQALARYFCSFAERADHKHQGRLHSFVRGASDCGLAPGLEGTRFSASVHWDLERTNTRGVNMAKRKNHAHPGWHLEAHARGQREESAPVPPSFPSLFVEAPQSRPYHIPFPPPTGQHQHSARGFALPSLPFAPSTQHNKPLQAMYRTFKPLLTHPACVGRRVRLSPLLLGSRSTLGSVTPRRSFGQAATSAHAFTNLVEMQQT